MIKNDIIFKKIINKTIPANIIYQNKNVTAFQDIKPKALIHILIIPNIFIKSLNEINENNKNILIDMFDVAFKIIKEKQISHKGYRIVINCNEYGGQEINYLHMHLLGGEKLKAFA